MYSVILKIDGVPELPNRIMRSHWSKISKHANLWKKLVAMRAVGKKPPYPLARSQAILTRCSARKPDYDNLVASFKPVVDGLINCGIIVDDNPAYFSAEYKWEKIPQKQAHILISISEIQ